MLFRGLQEKLVEIIKILNKRSENPVKSNRGIIALVDDKDVMLFRRNDNRRRLVIQNVGTNPCYIKLGGGCANDDYHFILAADTADEQGNGGSIDLSNWSGGVSAYCNDETHLATLEY